MRQKRYLLLPVITLLLLTACQPVSGPLTRPEQPVEIEMLAAEQSGDYLQAAQQYQALAAESIGEKQALLYLRAANLFWQVSQVEDSKQALAKVDTALLPPSRQFDAALLGARIAVFEIDGDMALNLLTSFDENTLSNLELQQLYSVRIDAYALTENWLEKANSHLKLDRLLSDPEALAQNREALWQSLMQLTPQALDMFNPGVPPADDSGWFALAYAIKAYQANPEALEVALENWKRSYPNHPADPALYEKALTTGTRLPEQITDIAVLLPRTGPYADAASAIKQGIIAAHYASGSTSRLNFLDVDTDDFSGGSNVVQQYQQAVARHANIVIGPLMKQSVEALSVAGDLPVPVLALNRIDDQFSHPNLYQFGLAPEDDAVAVANYAHAQGYQRAIILAPQGEWGDRVTKAFADEWRQNNGTIIYQASYDEAENDFSHTLMPMLGLDDSKFRYEALKNTLGRALDYEPRRRQDIDFIFLVARPLKARQLVPQLRFHRSGDLPIIATSHAYSGQPDPQQDIDLNNLIVTDIPWMFADKAGADPAYRSLQSAAQHSGSLLRLNAMGADAYRLIPELNTLTRDPTYSFPGATGMLSINELGQIERQMPWARFRQGYIKLLQ